MTGPAPKSGDTRFTVDGTLEVFDGRTWAPYRPPEDDGYGMIFTQGTRHRAEAARVAALETELAALYCPHCGRGDCSPTADQWYEQKQRADQAEAALARVHAVCTRPAPSQPDDDESVPYSRGWKTALDAVQAALATLTPPGPLCDLPHATIADEDACDQAAADRGGEA